MNKVDMGSRKNHRLQLIVPFSWVLAGMKGFKQIKNVKEFIPTTIFFFFFFWRIRASAFYVYYVCLPKNKTQLFQRSNDIKFQAFFLWCERVWTGSLARLNRISSNDIWAHALFYFLSKYLNKWELNYVWNLNKRVWEMRSKAAHLKLLWKWPRGPKIMMAVMNFRLWVGYGLLDFQEDLT